MKVSGKIIKGMAKEYNIGPIDFKNMQANGKKIISMEMELYINLRKKYMRVSLKKIKSMEKEFCTMNLE